MLLPNFLQGLLIHYVWSVISLKIFMKDYCGGEGYLQGFVLDFTKMLDKKLLVFGEQRGRTVFFRNDKAQE